MKIDLDQKYVNADDTPAVDMKTNKPIDLRFMLIQAMLSDAAPSGGPIPNDQKVKRYDMYRTLKKSPRCAVFTAEDVAFLKDAAKVFPTLTMGQTHDMLETPWSYAEEPRDVVETIPPSPLFTAA